MMLINDTTVVFCIPEENVSLQRFMNGVDLSEWKREEVAEMICFRKHDFYMTGKKKEGEEDV